MRGGELKIRKVLFVLFALCFVSSLAFAQEAAAPVAAATPEAMVLKGYIIDNRCASANNADTLGEFVKTHTKQCALTPVCVESGYSIYADGVLTAFDKDSSAKVAEFLKKADSKLQVTVTAKQVGDALSLVSIENQN
jgi:hypothetical protein